MTAHNEVSLSEAIENLSALAQLEPSDQVELISKTSVARRQAGPNGEVKSTHHSDRLLHVVKESFRVILRYLETYHQRVESTSDQQHWAEGVKAMIVLAGEAAERLDRCTHLFQQGVGGSKVRKWPEFRDLVRFYKTTVIRPQQGESLPFKSFDAASPLIEWDEEGNVIGLQQEAEEEKVRIHGLEAIKADTEYELFYMKKESGIPFYDSGLLSNIKMACDFSAFHGDYFSDDPLLQVKNWHDKSLNIAAKYIYATAKPYLAAFFSQAKGHLRNPLVSSLYEALMALMLAKNSQNLLRGLAAKCCYRYFNDFLWLFRQALDSHEYYRLMRTEPTRLTPVQTNVINLIETLAQALYMHIPGRQELIVTVERMIERGEHELAERKETISNPKSYAGRLGLAQESLIEVLGHHPNGPLFKALDLFREEPPESFDPLLQDNIPHRLYDLVIDEQAVAQLRLPSPTKQESVTNAKVGDEFLALLRSYAHDAGQKRHLLINLQDRTAIPGHARSAALEQLQKQVELAEQLVVVTLTKDSDFYYQMPPYHDRNSAAPFKRELKEHLMGDATGYYFPKIIKEALSNSFIDPLIKTLHELFFQKKGELSRRERLDFIELTYLFLSLKLIELSGATSFSFTCKDGLDISLIASTELWLAIKWLNGMAPTKEEWRRLNMLLFSPVLLVRERTLLPERFQRLVTLVSRLEEVAAMGDNKAAQLAKSQLGRLYGSHILSAALYLPETSEGAGL